MVRPADSTRVSQGDADAALARLQASMKATRFTAAWPAELPGLIAVRLDSGEVAYTDKTGRYFIFGLILDTATGAALDKQLEGRH